MLEDVAALVVVDHPGDRAELDRREHHEQICWAVLRQDRHHVAGLHTLLGEHRGVAVHRPVGLTVGGRLTAEPHERPVRVVGGVLLEDQADGALGVSGPPDQPGCVLDHLAPAAPS